MFSDFNRKNGKNRPFPVKKRQKPGARQDFFVCRQRLFGENGCCSGGREAVRERVAGGKSRKTGRKKVSFRKWGGRCIFALSTLARG